MSYLRTRLCSCDTRSLLYQVLYCTVLYFTVLYCTLMYQLTALLLMSVMGFGSYFCYDRCPSSAATCIVELSINLCEVTQCPARPFSLLIAPNNVSTTKNLLRD